MSVYHGSGARGLKRFPSLKYNNVQKEESRFTTERSVAEVNTGSGADKLTQWRQRPKTKKTCQWWCNFSAAHTSTWCSVSDLSVGRLK